MARADVYSKYRVYFFLYLAVISELLIVIVERDDAEELLLEQQRALEEKNRKIILELLKNMPTVAAVGNNQLKVGDSRTFTISVKGLGDQDEVTTPPEVDVYKEGVPTPLEVLNYPANIQDSTLESTTGTRLYKFDWTADLGPGTFEFRVRAGTNRVEIKMNPEPGGAEEMVKVGRLEFTREEIQNAIDSDPQLEGTPVEHFIEQSENLDPATFFVEVISEAYDQLGLQAEDVTTAVGFPTVNEIKIRGTTVDNVASVDAAGGGICLDPRNPRNPFQTDDPEKGKWVWTGSFNEPGDYQITLNARGNRGAGALDVAKPITFTVHVKKPFLRRRMPLGAYAGEFFNMNISVVGLDNVTDYAWQVFVDNTMVLDGTGPTIDYKVPDTDVGKTLRIEAMYKNQKYGYLADSSATEMQSSTFTFPITPQPIRIVSESFASGKEYPINTPFSFVTAKCGVCSSKNIKNVQRNEIRIEVESAGGEDLLDEIQVEPQMNPNTGTDGGTKVTFYLRGRVSREGDDATIRIRVGSVEKTYDIILYRE